jgi:hypothetical protein
VVSHACMFAAPARSRNYTAAPFNNLMVDSTGSVAAGRKMQARGLHRS